MTGKAEKINIIGAGIAGLSAAIYLAERGITARLISKQPSERAQSVLAEGGINAALDTMGEHDSPEEHIRDTLKGGAFLASEEEVRGLCEAAPGLVAWLWELGVPFHAEGKRIVQRNFGGQKKKRTAYAKSSSGKAIMTALIDEARKYEAWGLIERFPAHELCGLAAENTTERKDGPGPGEAEKNAASERKRLGGVWIREVYRGEIGFLRGPAILCTGGLNGFFPGHTTGTTANDGSAAAIAFDFGAAFSNLEMIQYHPTTAAIPGKSLLVSEAARGEGGRLYIERGGRAWYFMEEKYPELGNLMPRDVVSREIAGVLEDGSCKAPVYLDLRGLSKETWKKKLSDLRSEIKEYLGLDPAKEPVPVEPGIHFFMGGLAVDKAHRTNIENLYAAGEAAAIYHGANRLGGNSLLGALYGGRVAAETAAAELISAEEATAAGAAAGTETPSEAERGLEYGGGEAAGLYDGKNVRTGFDRELSEILLSGLGIVRSGESIELALSALAALETKSREERLRREFAEAMLLSALSRKESRGAHYRSDYPERDDENFRRATLSIKNGGGPK